ncbi:WD40 repeat domain-containing protein [Duganella violaceipulchra]|uniref:WD40 repeat domain-containing protein n=1 Tax=Duganella violaceipulchra TaxID=2849652 RepID=A0AA41HAA2_9BURK|nr:WD40 repeat domain-containing protein [Duganella violaceicalia]MBV6324888.1 WD40 repeat domain-containing protein [Duganella violaceicalia]MCP2012365.1 hypothetical protein [Duganella violaceicalia]
MKYALSLAFMSLLMASAVGQDAPPALSRPLPTLQHLRDVDISTFWHKAIIRQLAFSPNSKYLAIKLDPMLGTTDVTIIEIRTGKKISTMHSPEYLGMSRDEKLQWLDNEIVFLGSRYRWNALTGTRLTDAPVIGWQALFNKDRSKLATVENGLGTPSYLHIYDTKKWSDQRTYVDDLSIATMAWTSDGNLIMSVGTTPKAMRKTIEGYQILQGADVALRLFNTNNQIFTKTIWFPAHAIKTDKGIEWNPSADLTLGISCFGSNNATLSVNKYLDGRTLTIKQFYTNEQVKSNSVAMIGGQACSADGRFLFIKDVNSFDGHHKAANSIIDLALAKQVGTFPGGEEEIATSDDGRFLAFGGGKGASIFFIK